MNVKGFLLANKNSQHMWSLKTFLVTAAIWGNDQSIFLINFSKYIGHSSDLSYNTYAGKSIIA
jgi:hypothetical protein